MDEADFASVQEERLLELYIKAARGIPLVIDGDGHCLWCEAVIELGRLCGTECRDMWERE